MEDSITGRRTNSYDYNHGKKSKNKPNSMENRVHKFSEETTLHGLRKVCTEASLLKKILWGVVIVFMLAIYLYLVIGTIQKYFRFEIITSVQKVWNDTLDFPMITVCNVNNMAKSKVKEHFPELHIYLSRSSAHNEDTFNNSGDTSNKQDNMSNYSDLDKILELPLVEILERTMLPIDDMFLQCRWQNFVIPCSDYIKPFLTDMNFCYSIHTEKMLKVIQPGPDFGLSLAIDVHQEEYELTPASFGAGVFVLVHDQGTYPVMKQRSLSLSPGFEHYLSIEREEATRLKKPYASTDCTDDGNLKVSDGKHYSFEECLGRCALKTVYGPCNCTPYSRNPNEACKAKDLMTCGRFTHSRIYESNCNCKPACQEIRYDVRATSLAFPSNLGFLELQDKNLSRPSIDAVKENLMVVRIYFRGMEYLVTNQKPGMTIGQLIADIGGQLGLFLGASLITVVEFMEFASLSFWFCLTKRGLLKRPDHDNRNSV